MKNTLEYWATISLEILNEIDEIKIKFSRQDLKKMAENPNYLSEKIN